MQNEPGKICVEQLQSSKLNFQSAHVQDLPGWGFYAVLRKRYSLAMPLSTHESLNNWMGLGVNLGKIFAKLICYKLASIPSSRIEIRFSCWTVWVELCTWRWAFSYHVRAVLGPILVAMSFECKFRFWTSPEYSDFMLWYPLYQTTDNSTMTTKSSSTCPPNVSACLVAQSFPMDRAELILLHSKPE